MKVSSYCFPSDARNKKKQRENPSTTSVPSPSTTSHGRWGQTSNGCRPMDGWVGSTRLIGVFIKPAQKFSGKAMVKMKSLTRPVVFTVWGGVVVGYLEDWLQVGCNVVIGSHYMKISHGVRPWQRTGSHKPRSWGLTITMVINRLHPLG